MSNPLVKPFIGIVGCCWLIQPSPSFAQDSSAPSGELLEFLGEWVAADGQWLDPLELLEMDEAELNKAGLNKGELAKESITKTRQQMNSSNKADSE
jgi:hypothetical protein